MQISSEMIALVSAVIAAIAAFYAAWSAREARKANHLGRINALMAFREHYIKVMDDNMAIAQTYTDPGMKDAARRAYEEADSRFREIQKAIVPYHEKLVRDKF